MRIWLITVLALIGAAVSCVLLAASNLDSILESKRDEIAKQATATLGREIRFETLEADLGWGVSARVGEMRIAENPAFGDGDFLQVGDARAYLKLLPLFSGRIEIGRVLVDRPAIRLIQTDRGLSAATLGPADAAEESADDAAESALALAVATVDVRDAHVVYIDRSVTPSTEIEITGLDLTFRSKGTLDAIRGTLGIHAPEVRRRSGGGEEEERFEPLDLKVQFSRRGEIADIENLVLRVAGLRVDAEATLSDLSGEPKVRATLASPGGEFGGVAIERVRGNLQYDDSEVTFSDVEVGIFEGVVRVEGAYDLRDAEKPTFDLAGNFKDVQLQAAAATQSLTLGNWISGALETEFQLHGTGSGWPALSKSLRGDGEVRVAEALLRDVNLAEGALQGLTGVPGLSGLLTADLRERYPALFQSEDTRFDTLSLDFAMADGRLQISELLASARDYTLRGQGQVLLSDLDVDISTAFAASEALSSDLLERSDKLALLQDGAGRVVVPLKVRGIAPQLRPQPDVSYLAKAMAGSAVKKALEESIGDRLRLPFGQRAIDPESAAPAADPIEADPVKTRLDALLGR